MQLDTEEGETFVPPAGVVAADSVESNAPDEDQAAKQDGEEADSSIDTVPESHN